MLLLPAQGSDYPGPCTSSTVSPTRRTWEAEQGADPVPPNAHVSHVVVGEIEAEVPESLVEVEQGSARAPG